jgi:fructose-1,6-bisphosphatase-3
VLRNASGVIRRKVEEVFGHTLRESEKTELCTLIYYPEGKLKVVKHKEKDKELDEWYKVILMRLVQVCAAVSSKYTRSKVRKAMPPEYEYIIQELLHESKGAEANKHDYIAAIVKTIITTGRADHFIIAICNLIQRLTIDSLHIIGDIYDRGPGAHIILDILENYHNWDVQWGNHDLVWMGAAAGSKACVANVVRICSRYANFKILEEGYGINLLPLVTFAMDVYGDDPCTIFRPKGADAEGLNPKQTRLVAQMHKAITIMQFKLEHEVIKRHPEYNMDDRNLLHLINREKGTITLDGRELTLKDDDFQTVDPADPYKLTPEEENVINRLTQNFINSAHMAKHMQLLYSHGALYLVRNSNLLFHGSVPLNEDGSFKALNILGKDYAGKALFDKIDQIVRQAYFEPHKSPAKQFAQDFVWYLWCGPVSPPFDKNRMATFERYFLSDKEAQKEQKGWYNIHKNNKEICEKILKEFGVEGEPSHIINGHIPVKTTKGESPIKAGGRLLVIDGGYSKPYQAETGIAGYTLIYNSYGLRLVQHEPFESTQNAIEQGKDIISETKVVEFMERRKLVRDTDIGKKLIDQIDDLKQLLVAFRKGQIR